jgi:hypothetical protein
VITQRRKKKRGHQLKQLLRSLKLLPPPLVMRMMNQRLINSQPYLVTYSNLVYFPRMRKRVKKIWI